ncbi:unnamed protein product [Eruca vesicaria subsp. sativa]|uniref:Uncharacterized protein n=1 Tax=Eruca vesicaria subsp. sativa TaxID=29727 RepID=A0ABC8KX66_ERUVS|nr:unnamed protein product [Eruca vesicaria subsp. sativa]
MELDGKKIALETNDYDFGLSTQDMENLSQDTFVHGFDLSQVKVEKPRKSRSRKTSTLNLRDEQIHRTGEASPDAALVYIREEDWEKVRNWSTYATPLQIGPAKLDSQMAALLITKTEWLANSVNL